MHSSPEECRFACSNGDFVRIKAGYPRLPPTKGSVDPRERHEESNVPSGDPIATRSMLTIGQLAASSIVVRCRATKPGRSKPGPRQPPPMAQAHGIFHSASHSNTSRSSTRRSNPPCRGSKEPPVGNDPWETTRRPIDGIQEVNPRSSTFRLRSEHPGRCRGYGSDPDRATHRSPTPNR